MVALRACTFFQEAVLLLVFPILQENPWTRMVSNPQVREPHSGDAAGGQRRLLNYTSGIKRRKDRCWLLTQFLYKNARRRADGPGRRTEARRHRMVVWSEREDRTHARKKVKRVEHGLSFRSRRGLSRRLNILVGKQRGNGKNFHQKPMAKVRVSSPKCRQVKRLRGTA